MAGHRQGQTQGGGLRPPPPSPGLATHQRPQRNAPVFNSPANAVEPRWRFQSLGDTGSEAPTHRQPTTNITLAPPVDAPTSAWASRKRWPKWRPDRVSACTRSPDQRRWQSISGWRSWSRDGTKVSDPTERCARVSRRVQPVGRPPPAARGPAPNRLAVAEPACCRAASLG